MSENFERQGDLGKLEERGIRSDVGKREEAKQMLALTQSFACESILPVVLSMLVSFYILIVEF